MFVRIVREHSYELIKCNRVIVRNLYNGSPDPGPKDSDRVCSKLMLTMITESLVPTRIELDKQDHVAAYAMNDQGKTVDKIFDNIR